MTPSSESYSTIPLTRGYETLVDAADYATLMTSKWQVVTDKHGHTCAVNRRRGKMHRFLMALPSGDSRIVDHINGNSLDNRRCNLRIVSRQQNAFNTASQKESLSGHKGVIPRFKNGKQQSTWRAYITKDYKQIRLGSFPTLELAIEARKKAEKELFAEFSSR